MKNDFLFQVRRQFDSARKEVKMGKVASNSGQCNICGRLFRDAEHLAKHKRGALCRRLVQRSARRHRKLAMARHTPQTSTQHHAPVANKLKKSRHSYMYKPYQCSLCGARFFDKVNVELHLERQHNTTQQLWVEVSKVKPQINIENVGSVSHACIANSVPPNSSNNETSAIEPAYGNLANTASCIDISNNNTSNNNNVRLYNNDRLKCILCHSVFQTESQLLEHRRITHNDVSNTALDSTNTHLLQQVSASGSSQRNMPYITNNSAMCSDSNLVLPNLGNCKNMLTRLDSNNVAVHQQLPPGYIFQSNYYSNEPSTSSLHQQAAGAHSAHVAQYLTPPQQQSMPQHLTHPGPPQQDLPLTHNNTLQQQQQGVIPTASQHQVYNTAAAMASVAVESSHVMPISSISSTSEAVTAIDQVLLNNSANELSTSNSSMSIGNNDNCNNLMIAAGCSSSSSTRVSNCGSSPSSIGTSVQGISSNANTSVKPHPTVAAKWNMCGECGIKFLDVMNLELHVERKHPNLRILGSVDLGEGIVCYKTGVVNSRESDAKSCLTKELSKESKGFQLHTCSLCNLKSNTLVSMADHMLNVHFLTGKNMMDAILSEGDTSEQPQIHKRTQHKDLSSSSQTDYSDAAAHSSLGPSRANTKANRQSKDLGRSEGSSFDDYGSNKCHSCQVTFKSSAELIRHRIKDKKHTCVICCYVTCSKQELSEHKKSEHDLSEFSSTMDDITQLQQNKLTCFKCTQEFKKTADFLDHLKIHGSLTGKCEKCGKQDYNVANILIHMTTLHGDYMNKLTITVMSKGKILAGTYLQTLSGDLMDIVSVSSSTSNKDVDIKPDELTIMNCVKTRSKAKKRCGEGTDKSKRAKDKDTPSSDSNLTVADAKTVYACSHCRVCLVGSHHLENHVMQHQDCLTNDDQDENLTKSLLGGFSIKRSPSQDTASSPSPSKDDHWSGGFTDRRPGLEPLPNTCGFKCDECGVTRSKSDALISHIQKRHISGSFVHMLLEGREVKNYTICVVTPILSV